MSYSFTEGNPKYPAFNQATSASGIPQQAFSVIHDSYNLNNNNLKKEAISIRKQKKSFRTAKFLLPVQMNIQSQYQYNPNLPQFSNPKIINKNLENHNQTSLSMDFHRISDQPTQNSKFSSNDKIFNKSKISFNNDKESYSLNFVDSTNSQNSGSTAGQTFNFPFIDTLTTSNFYNADASNLCFDIVGRGNFPSILMKNGFVQVVYN